METVRPLAYGVLDEGKIATTDPTVATLLGINVGSMPLDEGVLVLISNESSTAARIGYGTVGANTPSLAANSERYEYVTAGLAKNMVVQPVTGTGVIIGWRAYRAAQ